MRKVLSLGVATAVFMALAGVAQADKTATAFVDPASLLGGTNGFTNANSANLATKTYSVGAAKQSGCKLKVQFKGLSGFADGERMFCLAGADADAGLGFAGNTIVLRVPYSNISKKAQTKADIRDTLCGLLNATAINTGMACYKEDGGYDPATTCAGDGGGWIPNTTFVEASAATDGLMGVCQLPALGARLTPPGSGLVARDGISTPALP